MADLELAVSLMPYDITRPFMDGRTPIDGVKLRPVQTMSMVFGDLPALRTGDFGLWDLNLGYLLPAIEAGWELVALPVFCKRKAAYQFIICGEGITSPKDLEGKRIGSGSYRTALTVFARGLLQHRHGVDINSMRWVIWRDEFLPMHDTHTSIEKIADPKKTVVQALLDGDVDALITDISDVDLFREIEEGGRIHRLFPDYEEEDFRLYEETGIFSPVHLVVMSKHLDRDHPELARKVYDAFVESKRLADWDMLSDRGGLTMPYLRERILEQRRKWGDVHQYGVKANARTMDVFQEYNVEQGMTARKLAPEEIWAAGVLDT
ncbi:MAG TPA: PhnD/SsuA/transferrin family substrate-binding protein [Chloroflexota bacterium]|nr:PhnD/SsuA/transferrin family substrate-binding protein [Chloroflexota bacterium]